MQMVLEQFGAIVSNAARHDSFVSIAYSNALFR